MRHVAMLVLAFFAAGSVSGQVSTKGLRLWLRADSLTKYTTPAGGTETLDSWGALVDGKVCQVAPGGVIVAKPINGKAALSFNGGSYLTAPSVFPVGSDYTLYLVFEWNGVHSANNMISGVNRALFTSSPGQPTLLHSADFNRLLMAESALSGPTVLRVTYNESTRLATISYNGKEVATGEVPVNIDSVIFIGAYQNGYCLNGSLAEVLIYSRIPEPKERESIESYLHLRYSIPQYREPAQRPVVVVQAPKDLSVVPPSASLPIVFAANRQGVRSVTVRIEQGTQKMDTVFTSVEKATTYSVPWTSPPAGFTQSTFFVIADTGSVDLDTVYRAGNVVSGIAFTVTGQSNSIFGDATVQSSAWARTFGKNFSNSASDTVFYRSKADGSGGGPHVGAWGLHLQNAMASELSYPTLCVNGGVGGTRIEQHLPDPNNRLNRNTIYGSWLYRTIKSGMKDQMRWLFWYQGESNHGSDDYTKLFGQLYNAWKQDLPNLKYVVVVQIRPGCAGPNHAKLRDEMRRLEYQYPDVIVHSANALPAHDGCHYGGAGYTALGEQLFSIYKLNELGMQPGIYRSAPTVRQINPIDDRTVRVHFDRAGELRMTSDVIIGDRVRTSRDAWFANGDGLLHPDSVVVQAPYVTLTFSKPISEVSYVPDYAYDDGTTVYEGPWLVGAGGVGAISFHNVPVTTTYISDDATFTFHHASVAVRRDQMVEYLTTLGADHIYSVTGNCIVVDDLHRADLALGVYVVVSGQQTTCVAIIP